MRNNKNYSTIVDIGDCYEFCVVKLDVSHVMYGRIIGINKKNKTFKFERLNNGLDKKKTGEVYDNVDAVRKIGYVHDDTWKS